MIGPIRRTPRNLVALGANTQGLEPEETVDSAKSDCRLPAQLAGAGRSQRRFGLAARLQGAPAVFKAFLGPVPLYRFFFGRGFLYSNLSTGGRRSSQGSEPKGTYRCLSSLPIMGSGRGGGSQMTGSTIPGGRVLGVFKQLK